MIAEEQFAGKVIGGGKMSRFSIQLEVANNSDLSLAARGVLEPDKVRRKTIEGVVDPGATRLVLPKSLVKELGLEPAAKAKVTYADRRSATRDTVKNVYVEIQGRSGTFTALVEPRRTTALIGAIVLEDLDFLVDCRNERLVPRDPRYVVSEVE
jgi:predicted aspartyl protease